MDDPALFDISKLEWDARGTKLKCPSCGRFKPKLYALQIDGQPVNRCPSCAGGMIRQATPRNVAVGPVQRAA